MQTKRRKRQLTMPELKAQRKAAFATIRALYAAVMPLWRSCGRGYCLRHRCCAGDVRACVARSWPLLSKAEQNRVYAQVVKGGPQRIPPQNHTEWSLRRFPSSNFVHT